MISILGRSAVLLALAACSVGAVTGIVGGARNSAEAWRWSRIMAYTAFFAMLAAIGLMEYALITHDFSVSYVAQVGSTRTPLWVSIVSLWSSLEGSILLWAFVLASYIGAFAWLTRDRYPEHTAWALGVSQAVGIFFMFLVAGVANPFSPEFPVPTEGPGPNPLLQNHILMVIHPPSLYLGYVGMSVPFGMGCAALLAGKIGPSWSQALRQWTLVPWGFLTAGIILGGWWSYEVLGWGGYWAWDPVENASFLPWLTATAFIHSAIMTQRRGQLKGWSIILLLATFLLTLLGTFMTRSGIFNSVHSFTQTDIGPIFLGFLAFCTLVSFVLLALRLDVLAPNEQRETELVSRDSAFLLNNLLFSASTFTVLIGTVYPLINEALTDEKLSVGVPYFNKMSIPLWLLTVFLMGVGPALPWGRISQAEALKRMGAPAIGAVLATAIAVALGVYDWLPLLSFAVCGFALVATLREFHEPALARARKLDEPYLSALGNVASRSRRRFGGYTVHVGVIIIAAAVTASGSFKETREITVTADSSAEVLGYELTFLGSRMEQEDHRRSEVAAFSISKNGRSVGVLEPRMNMYLNGMNIGTPAVRTGLGEDLYLSLINTSGDRANLQVITQPMVFWLWFGGGVMVVGTLIAAWPARRRRKGARGAQAAK
ncbi:MAG: heme lyase CcmF/NrfE family subunit [Myxococcota bacterium]